MRTSKKNVGLVFNVFLFAAILLIPATAFNANAQEEYKEEKNRDYEKYYNDYNDKYQYNKDDYGKYDDKDLKKSYDDYYKPHKEKKKDPIVTIKKELFICDDVLDVDFPIEDESTSFGCFFEDGASPPTDENYIECNDIICPGIDESTFSAFIHKDVATIKDLNPIGIPVNLAKFHYTVVEDELDDSTGFGSDEDCSNHFTERLGYTGFNEFLNLSFNYNICVIYEGDCEGIIYAGEEKICTIKNYIFDGAFRGVPEFSIESIETTVNDKSLQSDKNVTNNNDQNITDTINSEILVDNNMDTKPVINNDKKHEDGKNSIPLNIGDNNSTNIDLSSSTANTDSSQTTFIMPSLG